MEWNFSIPSRPSFIKKMVTSFDSFRNWESHLLSLVQISESEPCGFWNRFDVVIVIPWPLFYHYEVGLNFPYHALVKKIFIHVIESIIMRGIIGSLNKRFFSHLLTNGDFTQVLLFDLEIVICGKSLDFSISCSYKKICLFGFLAVAIERINVACWNKWFGTHGS